MRGPHRRGENVQKHPEEGWQSPIFPPAQIRSSPPSPKPRAHSVRGPEHQSPINLLFPLLLRFAQPTALMDGKGSVFCDGSLARVGLLRQTALKDHHYRISISPQLIALTRGLRRRVRRDHA